MEVFRNKAIRWEIGIGIAATLLAAAGASFWEPLAGLLLLLLGGGLTGVHLYFCMRRYRNIALLSQDIDRILHGEEQLLIRHSAEGELAVLQSEIFKMTVRLQEQTDLLRQDKIRLTEAIADIFHQIRTPLTSMNLVIAMLGDSELPYEKRVELTHELKRQTERIRWLVETLLKLSKIDAGTAVFQSAPVKVSELLQTAARPFWIPMELRNQTLRLDVREERFMGDAEWTAEAIGNLFKNCMEHTPAGGTVMASAAETALYTEITVEDTGEGIDPDDLPHLFERYYKGKNATSESIGIGLALARSIVAAQNGTIAAQNRKDGGARFIVRFYKTVI